jgi:hypothetical protein
MALHDSTNESNEAINDSLNSDIDELGLLFILMSPIINRNKIISLISKTKNYIKTNYLSIIQKIFIFALFILFICYVNPENADFNQSFSI